MVVLGRNRACTLAKAMEGERELRRRNALRRIHVLTVGLSQDLRCRNHGEPILVLGLEAKRWRETNYEVK